MRYTLGQTFLICFLKIRVDNDMIQLPSPLFYSVQNRYKKKTKQLTVGHEDNDYLVLVSKTIGCHYAGCSTMFTLCSKHWIGILPS